MGLKQFRLARQRLKHEISGKRMPHQELAADIGRKLLLYIRKQILRQKAKETGLTAIGVSRIITADRICRCCREIEIAPRLIIGLRPGIAYADDDRGRNAGCFRPSGGTPDRLGHRDEIGIAIENENDRQAPRWHLTIGHRNEDLIAQPAIASRQPECAGAGRQSASPVRPVSASKSPCSSASQPAAVTFAVAGSPQ